MTKTKLDAKHLEELFLKIFKTTILLIMGAALVAIVVTLISAAYQFMQTPTAPQPARAAPVETIELKNLNDYLQEQERKRLQLEKDKQLQESGGQPSGQLPSAPARASNIPSVRFLEDATELYRCAEKFGISTSQPFPPLDDVKTTQEIDMLRRSIESDAMQTNQRGVAWVKAMTAFTCSALKDNELIALKKVGKVGQVFRAVMYFHKSVWDEIQTRRITFEQREQARVISETQAEQARVVAAKAKALGLLMAAGAAFALFMLLALYLILSKIEYNLRGIYQNTDSLKTNASNHTTHQNVIPAKAGIHPHDNSFPPSQA